MLGGRRIPLSHQEQYVWPTPVTMPFVVPSAVITIGPVPLRVKGSYAPAVAEDGSYTPAISKTAG